MQRVTAADGTTIADDRSGDGPAVILVGGAFGDRDEPTVAGLAEALASGFTVFDDDRRDRGESGDTRLAVVELRTVVAGHSPWQFLAPLHGTAGSRSRRSIPVQGMRWTLRSARARA